MKYALESLPELIGEDDFERLIMALGIDRDLLELNEPNVSRGQWFSRTVNRMAANNVEKRRQERNQVGGRGLL